MVQLAESLKKDYDIFIFSNKTGEGLNEIKSSIKSGLTYCLLGSSGVGKTTLLNSLIGQNVYATGVVREEDGKGRHITARRQLSILEQGGLIIDTPGMRELGSIGVHAGLNETFKDIVKMTKNCRFKNCTHTSEPGCFVLQAVERGEISAKRYQNYLRIRKESEYYELSYLEKRKKDKNFGTHHIHHYNHLLFSPSHIFLSQASPDNTFCDDFIDHNIHLGSLFCCSLSDFEGGGEK